MPKKREEKSKLEWKYVILSVIAGLLSYLAYYLKFPNTYGMLVSLFFLIVMILSFKKLQGISVIIYSMIVSAVVLPMTVFLMPLSLTYQIGILLIEILLISLIGFGLFKTKKWAAILSIITNLVASYTLVYSAVLVLKSAAFSIYLLLFIIRNSISLLFTFAIIVYLLTFWNKFK